MAKRTSKTKGGYDKALYKSPMYRTWFNMKTRCLNKNAVDYERYGGRGISVCEKWLDFKGFYEDMGASWVNGLSLDRVNNHAGYSIENCRWATPKEQAQNTRNVERAIRYEVEGKKMTIREMAERFGLKRSTLDMRLRSYGWTLTRALSKKTYG